MVTVIIYGLNGSLNLNKDRYYQTIDFLKSRDAIIFDTYHRRTYQTLKANLLSISMAAEGRRVTLVTSHLRHTMMTLLDAVGIVEPNHIWSHKLKRVTLPNNGSITILQLNEFVVERVMGTDRGSIVVDSDYRKYNG